MVQEAEKKLFDSLIQRRAINNKNAVVYTAGYIGYDFLDLSKLTLSPKTSKNVVDMYKAMLVDLRNEGFVFNKLAFIDRTIGPMMISSELSREMNLESVVVKSRIPCSCKMCDDLRIKGSVEPPVLDTDRIVIISDVLTTGGTLLDVVKIIEKKKAKVIAVVTILDRQVPENTAIKKQKIKEKGIKLRSLITRDELLVTGFAMPFEDDLRRIDFLDELKKAIDLTDEETGFAKSYLDSLAKEILETKEDASINEENLLFTRNMLLSLAVGTRINVLQAIKTADK